MTDPRRRFFPMRLTQQVPGQSVELSTRLRPVGTLPVPVTPVQAAPPGECYVRGVSLIDPTAIGPSYGVVAYAGEGWDPWNGFESLQLLHVADDIYIQTMDGTHGGDVVGIWQGQPQPRHFSADGKIVGRPDPDLRMIYAAIFLGWRSSVTGVAMDACGFQWRFRWQHPLPANYLVSPVTYAKVMPLGPAFAVVDAYEASDLLADGDVLLTPIEDLPDPYAEAELPIIFPAAARAIVDNAYPPQDRLIATAYCANAPQASLVVDVFPEIPM